MRGGQGSKRAREQGRDTFSLEKALTSLSGFTFYVLRTTHHVLRTTLYALRLTPYASLLLFLVALLPRLPGLARFLTSDENTNIFFAGSDVIAAFSRGDWRGTYWHFYPGVTMSWLDALGMGGQYLWERLQGRPLPAFTAYIYGDILGLVVANRLPYAFLTAAAVPLLYLLARRLLPAPVAFLGALFLAFDPFFLAHSRVAHGDAPVAVFMSLSALSLLIYAERLRVAPSLPPLVLFRQPAFIYLVISAVCGGLAALTKAPGQFMALFTVELALLYFIYDGRYNSRSKHSSKPVGQISNLSYNESVGQVANLFRPSLSNLGLKWLTVVTLWGLISLAVFVLLWPAMWVEPFGTLNRMWAETFGKVNEGHLVYFFGQPTLDPGPWFYFYVIPFRLTPIMLAGVLLSLLFLFPRLNLMPLSRSPEVRLPAEGPTRPWLFSVPTLLWLFVLSLLLFSLLSPKKQDRYLLPLFPILALLAAVGWVGSLYAVGEMLRGRFRRDPLGEGVPPSTMGGHRSPQSVGLFVTLASLLLLLFHASPVLSYYPYYLTYFNPLLGGPTRAARTTLMGWGEGMEQAAAYLNTRPGAEQLYVASTPSQTLLPYFVGAGENFYTNDIALRADYVVLYLAQIQRLAPSPEIVAYFQAQTPEKTITIKGVEYAKIYPGPKLILPDIPASATPINIGLEDQLRLAGYSYRPAQGDQKPELSLYWHALAPLPVDYTISVRAWATDRLLFQQDSWPVQGLLPTRQWRQGDYVSDSHPLDLSLAEAGQIDHFEVVVYDALTGETLDPPITLPLSHD